MNQVVLITGATSGIGLALAKKFLQGNYKVIIASRNIEKVHATSKELSEYPNFLKGVVIDVDDYTSTSNTLLQLDDEFKINIIVANAGVSSGVLVGNKLDMQQFDTVGKAIFQTNVFGVFNTVHPLISRLQNRENSKIVIISSLSAFFGLKSAVFYAASKAAIKSYGEGLRLLLKDYNIQVSNVFPGFVESNITSSNTFKMPFLMSGEQASNIIIKGIENKKGYIIFPKILYIIIYFISILPFYIREKILSRLPNK